MDSIIRLADVGTSYAENEQVNDLALESLWDISGTALDPWQVRKARDEDMQVFRDHKVYAKAPVAVLVRSWKGSYRSSMG